MAGGWQEDRFATLYAYWIVFWQRRLRGSIRKTPNIFRSVNSKGPYAPLPEPRGAQKKPSQISTKAVDDFRDPNGRTSVWSVGPNCERLDLAILTSALSHSHLRSIDYVIVKMAGISPNLHRRFLFSYNFTAVVQCLTHHYEGHDFTIEEARSIAEAARSSGLSSRKKVLPEIENLIISSYVDQVFEVKHVRNPNMRMIVEKLLATNGIALRE